MQIAAAELGLAVDGPTGRLTLTGGLTFGGGPGNNYTAHGIAQPVRALRATPGTAALVTGLGWYATKHSLGVYASRPPAHGGSSRSPGATSSPRSTPSPSVRSIPAPPGPVRVETYTVTFDREGGPDRGILACRTPEGSRAWGNVTDRDTLTLLCTEEGIGRSGVLATDGTLALDG